MLGLKGPRKMTLLLPGLDEQRRPRRVPYRNQAASRLQTDFQQSRKAGMLVLVNKEPQWNEGCASPALDEAC